MIAVRRALAFVLISNVFARIILKLERPLDMNTLICSIPIATTKVARGGGFLTFHHLRVFV